MLDLYAAWSKVQSDIKNAPKDSNNPHFKSRYASLGSVIDTVKPVLEKHGLIFLQHVRSQFLVTRIVHAATGQEFEDSTPLVIPPDKQNPQGLGAAITYARRFGLSTICGIVSEEDDDGNSLSKPAPKTTPAQPATRVADVEVVEDSATAKNNKALSDKIKKNLNDVLGFKAKSVEVK